MTVQISRVSGPELRDALAALVATALDHSRRDPQAVSALTARLTGPPPTGCPAGDPAAGRPRDVPSPSCRGDVSCAGCPTGGPDAGRRSDVPPAGQACGAMSADCAWDAEQILVRAGRAWSSGDATRAIETLRRLDPAMLPRETAAGVRLLAGEIALRAAEPGDAVTSLLEAADLLADSPAEEAEALLRAGEAICFLGDHYRYADVTRRAARCGLAGTPAAWIEGFGALFDGRYPQAVATLRRVVAAADLGSPASDGLASDGRASDGPAAGGPAVDGPVTGSPAGRPSAPGPAAWGTGAITLLRASAAALACGDDAAALRLVTRAEGVAEARLVPRMMELKGSAELWRGAHDAAESIALAGARAAVDAGQPNEADNHLAMLALLAALRGDRAACRWRLAQLHGCPGRPRALGRWALALLDLQAGRPQEAAARLAGIADVRSGRGHVLVQMMAVPDLVEAAVLAGDPGVATAALTAFDRWAASTGEPLRRALSARCHALLARRGSAEADAGFREALRLHLAGESEFARARTQLLFGRDLRRRRRPGQAREQVGAALDTFVRCGARAWAEQARAELRVCGGDARSVTEPLTAQQLQIARLVADGATNREVAARLFLSTRTVDHHMRNIFHRLGISSRVALAKMIT